MLARIDPNAELGPTGLYVGAGIFVLIALVTLISGLHPRLKGTAQWFNGTSRSPIGTVSFSVGVMVMAAGMVVRGIMNQHGPFAGIALWLFCGGTALAVLGLVYDWVRSVISRNRGTDDTAKKPVGNASSGPGANR